MKRWMFVFFCLFISVEVAMAQAISISGVVYDEKGETVIGGAVLVKGEKVGTVTEADGTFHINVPTAQSVLVFSSIGWKTKEVLATQGMKVVLDADSKMIDEIVVTAMGISREKKSLGYGSQGMKGDQLTQASNSSLSGAMQGKLAGIKITPSSGMPGASSQVVIRGSRSFTGDNTPLYVIDGMPISSTADVDTETMGNGSIEGTDYSNRAMDIDPNDIESMEVLKGQAASALYGIRASNGVIIITTKSGKNLAKGKPQVSISSSISFDKMSRYPEIQKTYAQGKEGEYDPTASTSWGSLISDLPNDPTYGGNVANGATNNGADLRPGMYYVPQRANAGLDPWASPKAYNNTKDYFETGVTWSNSVSVAQALDKSSYAISLSSLEQDGIVPTTGMTRYTAKIGADTKLTDQWTSGFVGTYINSSIDKMPGANDGIVATVYGAPASYDLKGIPNHYKDNPYKQNNYRGGTSWVNPYWFVDNNKFTEKTSRFFGNLYVNYATKLNSTDKKLNLKYQVGTDAYTTNYFDTWGYGNKGTTKKVGRITNYSWKNTGFNSLLTSNFDWTIDKDWAFGALVGNEIVQSTKHYLYQSASDMDFGGWNQIGNGTITSNKSKREGRRTVGFFGNIRTSYKNMLYLEATGREDIVSDMPRNNRAFFYPSISSSFILTELEGLKNNNALSFAKLRASYAEVGQAGGYQKNYYYKPEFGGGFYGEAPLTYPIDGANGYAPYYTVYDPNLKPQNTRSYELGFDASFFGGLLDLSYTFSRQNVKNQIFEVPLPGSTGFTSKLTNGGAIHTNAHEVTLNVNPIRSKDVNWSLGFNFYKIDNYVDELAPGVESIFLGGFTTPQVRAGINDKFPVIYGTSFKRDDKGNLVLDEKGLPMAGGDKVIAKVAPDFTLGFNTNIQIKRVSFAAVFDWKSGGQMYHGTKGLMDYYGVSKESGKLRDQLGGATGTFVVDGVDVSGNKNTKPVTAEAYYQAMNNIDESSIYDNGFIKIRELSLNYLAYKTSWVEVNVNAFARNILVWSELDSFDPESTQGNNNMGGAFERFSLPQTSTYGFGFNVKF